VTGERLAGDLAGKAAADWLLVGADGVSGTVDVREAVRTHDGALIFSGLDYDVYELGDA